MRTIATGERTVYDVWIASTWLAAVWSGTDGGPGYGDSVAKSPARGHLPQPPFPADRCSSISMARSFVPDDVGILELRSLACRSKTPWQPLSAASSFRRLSRWRRRDRSAGRHRPPFVPVSASHARRSVHAGGARCRDTQHPSGDRWLSLVTITARCDLIESDMTVAEDPVPDLHRAAQAASPPCSTRSVTVSARPVRPAQAHLATPSRRAHLATPPRAERAGWTNSSCTAASTT